MKRFITKVFCYIFLFGILNSLMFLHWKKDWDGYLSEFQDSQKGKIFLLADSHGLALKSNERLPGFVNLSYASDNYFDFRIKLEKLIESRQDVELILLQVDPHTLSPYRETSNNNDYSNLLNKSYLKYLPIFNAKYTTSILDRIFIKFRRLPIFDSGKNNVLNEEEDMLQKRYSLQFGYELRSEVLKNELNQIIDLCLKNEIKLIGIKLPLTKEYNDILGQKDYGAADALLSKGIPILNYQLYFNTDRYFRDQDHMNSLGGDSLLSVLVRDLSIY